MEKGEWLKLSYSRWNQLDIFIVFLSIAGIIFEEFEALELPINPTIIRVMRVLRIARGKFIKVNWLNDAYNDAYHSFSHYKPENLLNEALH